MKKILLLGGSNQQIIAIETAKRLGYRTVLCDYLPDNPGQYIADKYYQISTTDTVSVLDVARQEKVNGIVAYASDPAAPTAAFVAEKLGLPTNPYESVRILSEKHLFRQFLRANGFSCPRCETFQSYDTVLEKLDEIGFPLMVKPVDSSGSKGISHLASMDNLREAFDFALKFSRKKMVIIEEYVERDHPYIIGGDIFVKDGRVLLWGLLNCHRDPRVNPLVPVGKSYPLQLEKNRIELIHNEISRLIGLLRIHSGALNVEMIFKGDQLYIIECGPRNGGNMIPDLLRMITGVDLVAATIKVAMGEDDFDMIPDWNTYSYSTYNIHSEKDGIYEGIEFNPYYESRIIHKCLYKQPGNEVHYFDSANYALGIVFLKHNSKKQMIIMMENPDNWMKIQMR